MKNISEEHSKEILQEMYRTIGLVYEPRAFTSFDWFLKHTFTGFDWFLKHTWTPMQQEQFIKWLAEFLKKHGYARGKRRVGKTVIDSALHEARKLVFNYGWKTTEGK